MRNKKILIQNALIINEGEHFKGSILINDDKIAKIFKRDAPNELRLDCELIDANGLALLPGIIDDQVHFRDPGLTHKGDVYTESKAAVAGGITSFMEMPNTIPQATTQEVLEKKYVNASQKSLANYSFYIGATNDNIDELLKTDKHKVCGIKVFMGSSTGNMLVDSEESLSEIFSKTDLLIATHCEDEKTIQRNTKAYKDLHGEQMPIKFHPEIRSAEACYLSSSYAVGLAKKYDTRLHVLHLSSGKEMELFDNKIPSKDKRITAEVCVHHLWFDDASYDSKGTLIKWNPAIKSAADREALFQALIDNKLDVIATDHAPHTREEKDNLYFDAPSGGPLVQHALVAMLEFYHQQKLSLEFIVNKMCHAPADIFQVESRGYIREGYFADLVLVDLDSPWVVNRDNVLYKCGWSPFEGTRFQSRVMKTFVNGNLVYDNGAFIEKQKGMRITFNR